MEQQKGGAETPLPPLDNAILFALMALLTMAALLWHVIDVMGR